MEEPSWVPELLIYHESQTAALCGVHAVNTLLQAPHFSEVEMAQIAAELDAAERELMASAGLESAEYLRYMAEESGNVAESGMFSIQVLSKALEVFGLQAVPLTSPDAAAAREDPTAQQAFICNQQEHWLTVRKIHDQWWNLNSVYSAPEPLSNFYLAAFLDSLQEQGYTIFVIVGDLPASHPPETDAERFVPGVAGRWFTPEEAKAATQEREQLKERGFLKAAAATVMEKASQRGTWVTLSRPGAKRAAEASPDGGDSDGAHQGGEDPELAQALAASLADAGLPSGGGGGGGSAWQQGRRPFGAAGAGASAADDEDADLAAAIAASLADHAGTGSQQQQAAAAHDQQQQQQQQQQHQEASAGPMSVDMTADDDDDAELAAAIAASLQPPPATAAAAATEQAGQPEEEEEQQQQQQQQAEAVGAATTAEPTAAAAQLPELPVEPEAGAEGAIEVALRLPGGGRASRRFLAADDTVGHLAAFAAAQGADMAACQLAAQFPRRVFADWGQSLAAAGVGHKELVTVEPAAAGK